MTAERYHTAIKGKFDVVDIKPDTGGSGSKFLLLKKDVMKDGIPKEIKECDVIYSDPPWPHGFPVFNERAGAIDGRTFNSFADRLAVEIKKINKPIYFVCGKTLINKLPPNQGTLPVALNGGSATLVWWNDEFKDFVKTSDDIIKSLARRYASMGDCFCGYSLSLKTFINYGGKFVVGSDFDGKCIAVSNGVLWGLQ